MVSTEDARCLKKKTHATAIVFLCASLAGTLLPAAALASQEALPDEIAGEDVTSLIEGAFASNEQARWALGKDGNLAIAGSGAVFPDDAIYDICDQVEHVFISKDITSIEAEAFCYFPQLKSVEFEEGSNLKSVGAFAFSGCQELGYIDLPASVKTVGASAFLDCSKLSWASFGKGESALESISPSAFSNCGALSKIELPNCLETIGDYAFSGCDSLASITIPAKVKTVGEGAFENCPQLKDITIESPSTTRINGYAFSGTTKSKPATMSIEKIKSAKSSLKITWRKAPQADSYQLYYRQVSKTHWKSTRVKGTHKTIKKLKRKARYKLYVAAMEKGKVTCKSAIKTSSKVK